MGTIPHAEARRSRRVRATPRGCPSVSKHGCPCGSQSPLAPKFWSMIT